MIVWFDDCCLCESSPSAILIRRIGRLSYLDTPLDWSNLLCVGYDIGWSAAVSLVLSPWELGYPAPLNDGWWRHPVRQLVTSRLEPILSWLGICHFGTVPRGPRDGNQQVILIVAPEGSEEKVHFEFRSVEAATGSHSQGQRLMRIDRGWQVFAVCWRVAFVNSLIRRLWTPVVNNDSKLITIIH